MIEVSKDLSVRAQVRLLGLNRSTLYYTPSECLEDMWMANEISELWHEIPVYGYRRICAELQRRGYTINHKRVLRLMRESDLMAIYPKKKTRIKAEGHVLFPYLLRGLSITKPNQVWATDLTYIKVLQGFVYLMAMIDVYSRKIIAWNVSNSMDLALCLSILEEGLQRATPAIINTDQGSQYTSPEWTKRVLGAGSRVSMDSVGRWADNIPIERFWRTLKYENLFLKGLSTVDDVRQCVDKFIVFYNERRLHSALGYNTPHEIYEGFKPSEPVILGLQHSEGGYPPS